MHNLNQQSNATSYNRYPKIFKEVSSIIPKPKQILSFGCSTGLECNTLHSHYFVDTKIIGLDISAELIKKNIQNNKVKNIQYFNNPKQITKKCDLIFAMSVLCRWPELQELYTFKTFTDTLIDLDNLLEKNGYLCIYNSKYLFTETALFKKKYKKVDTIHKETGFVEKYHSNNRKVMDNYPFFLFKKVAV